VQSSSNFANERSRYSSTGKLLNEKYKEIAKDIEMNATIGDCCN